MINRQVLLVFVVLCVSMFEACTEIEHTEKDKIEKGNVVSTVVFENTYTDNTAFTRTTMKHVLSNGATVYWSDNDKIWVKDDSGVYQESAIGKFNDSMSRGWFSINTGSFLGKTYTVSYTGANGTAGDKVTIASMQRQTLPGNFNHLGVSGDCGTGMAKGGDGSFSFRLAHKAAYLCLLPRSANKFVKRSKIFKIEIVSEDDIAGVYDFSTGELGSAPLSGGSKTVTLTLTADDSGFEIDNSDTDMSKNGAYAVIAPGTHKLAIRYWLRNTTDGMSGTIEGTITKNVSGEFKAGEIYDLTANLTLRDYQSEPYYMWDAQNHYWKGYEGSQPYVNNVVGSNYPIDDNDANRRWYRNSTPASYSCKYTPTVNQLMWFVMKGDPHWDADELWSVHERLYKGGMWIKKWSKIVNDDGGNVSRYNNVDWRTYTGILSLPVNNSIKNGRPSYTKLDDYFYLPALGDYTNGRQSSIGIHGRYWSCNTNPRTTGQSFRLGFANSYIDVGTLNRICGFQTWRMDL